MSRLPTPGSDYDIWGQLLNDFLTVAHNSDGSLQSKAVEAAGAVISVNNKTPSNGNVTISAADVGAPTSLAGDSDVGIASRAIARYLRMMRLPANGQISRLRVAQT